MKIFYDCSQSQWFQSSVAEGGVTFGGEKKSLPFKDTLSNHSFDMTIHTENNHAGPLIGMLTARRADGTITGNSNLFIKLQEKLMSLGGFSFIFTPKDAHNDYIIGYTFLPKSNIWKKARVPYPDLVYNRVPFRKEEQSERCQILFKHLKKKRIPFFNPCFLDKYELYCLFQRHPFLKNFLPETELSTDQQKLYFFLKKHPCVYLKPSQSAKGKGIFRLTITPSEQLYLEGLAIHQAFSSFHAFWKVWEEELVKKQYVVQEEIQSIQYEGKKFDLRILAHAHDNSYSVTGVGIRQSQKQNLTTHIPNGGRLIPYELVRTEEHDQFVKMAVNEIGKTLSQEYGYFGEFSIDAGISTSGEYYIYEVNSKPMSFDEKEIEENKIDQLCRIFFQKTNLYP